MRLYFKLLLLVFVSGNPILAQKIDLDAIALQYAKESFEELKTCFSIPNDANFPTDIDKNIAWTKRAFEQRGFTIQTLKTATIPMLLAERRVKRKKAKTVLVYLQMDGQPVDPDFWLQDNPYEAVLKEKTEKNAWQAIEWSKLEGEIDRDWRIFARSASDAKGPVMAFLKAVDALDELNKKTDFNLKVIIDFEEELGSPQIKPTVERYKKALAADMLVVFDGPPHISNEPTLSFGARGIATLTLTVFGPNLPQHSGHYGNYIPNPALKLAQLLTSMKDESGSVLINGFYDGIELDNNVKSILRQVPDDEAYIKAKIGIAAADKVAPTLQEALQYPSLNVRGMQSGWIGKDVRTIIPSTAIAEIDMRLVVESKPEELVEKVIKHIKQQGYLVLDRNPTSEERLNYASICKLTSEVSYLAFRTEFDTPIGLWLERAMLKAHGKPSIKIRTLGGSIPISPFVSELDIPAVIVPTVNPDNNQHSPNENIRLGNYIDGIKTILAILMEKIENK